MKSWYSITAKADAKTADISIFDEIGYWGVTAKQFIGDLKALDATTIKMAINSPGGAVFDALAMTTRCASTRPPSRSPSWAWRPPPPRSSPWLATPS